MTILFNITGTTSFGRPSSFEEVRATIPTKSAFIGLIAAALGYDYNDSDHQQKMHTLYGKIKFAVQVLNAGEVEQDYLTALRTLKADGKINTDAVIVNVEYINDVNYLVAIEADSEQTEKTIARAIISPRYPLYLGKRSCPVNANFYNFKLTPAPLMNSLNQEEGIIYSDIKTKGSYSVRTQERIMKSYRAFGPRIVHVTNPKKC